MCDPILGQVAFTALTAVVGFAGDSEKANQQEEYNDKTFKANEDLRVENANNVISSYTEELASENLQKTQMEAQTSQDIMGVVKDALRASGNVTAGAMSGGNGASMVVKDLERQEAEYSHNAERNLRGQFAQSDQRKLSAKARATSSINSIRPFIPAPVQHPSLIAAALPVAGAGINAWDKWENRTVR